MTEAQFETKKIFSNSTEINNITSDNSKENLKPFNQNKEKTNKNNKSLFLVNRPQAKEEKKLDKPKSIINDIKEKELINSNNYISNSDEGKNVVKEEQVNKIKYFI